MKKETLKKKNVNDITSLTAAQEGLLFHYLKTPEDNLYFGQLCIRISGLVDTDIFDQTWNCVVEINEMLRTVFRWERVKQPVQIVLKESKLQPRYYDLSKENNHRKQRLIKEIKEKDREEKFNLRDIPFRVTLCKIREYQYEMIISNHHILYDGWSNGIILKEFFEIYNELYKGKPIKKPVKKNFKEFIKVNQEQVPLKQEKFWRDYLEGFDEISRLPIKVKKENLKGAGNCCIQFDPGMREKLDRFVKTHKITLASLFYSAWGILIHKYNDSQDIVFGMTTAGRPTNIRGIENIVGLFINTLPLRVKILPDKKVIHLLRRVLEVLTELEPYENAPLVKIKEYSKPANRDELFDNIVVIESYPLNRALIQKNRESVLVVDSHSTFELTHYPLTLIITPFDDIEVKLVYHKEWFYAEDIRRLFRFFIHIIQDMFNNPDKEISRIELVTGEEKRQLIDAFNNTEMAYTGHQSVCELLEEQVEKTPNNIAVIARGQGVENRDEPEKQHLTYRQLNAKANQLAHWLRQRGVKTETIVGIMVERSIGMMVVIIAILKAGGIYFPIDTRLPAERVKFLLKDSGAALLAAEKSTLYNKEIPDECQLVDLDQSDLFKGGNENLNQFHTPTSLAYVNYTSGSTGKPKGVLIENKSIVNLIAAITGIIDFRESDRILSLTSISFDIFTLETILPLTKGSRIIIGSFEEQLKPGIAASLFAREKVTIFQSTPSRMKILISHEDSKKSLNRLKYLLIGGEELPKTLLKEIRNLTDSNIYNLYGPTETTVWSTVKKVSGRKSLNIGKPISNTRIYILNKGGLLQPPGVPGELFIAGMGLARGYLNNPELTWERFVKNFNITKDYMYRTGDLAKWLPDGNIEFLGRKDYQVKIRGSRIEPGEIENQLLMHNEIENAVVVPWDDENGDKYLCAYIVGQKKFTITELREHLLVFLPNHIVPSYFIQLQHIPLTTSGKVNRKELPNPGESFLKPKSTYAPPESETEKIIADAWKEVLNLERVGIYDNFFEMGGNSLYIIRLSGKLNEILNKEIPILTLFDYPTIDSFSRFWLQQESGEVVIRKSNRYDYDTRKSMKKRLMTRVKKRRS